MTTETLSILLAVALAIGTALVLASILNVERTIRRSVYFTSRFPLFAARDHLVRLVAEKKMDERDALWRDAYWGVNDLLDASRRIGLVGLINRHLRFSFRLATNRELQRRFGVYYKGLKEAAERVPDFGQALVNADRAVFEMCRRRTSPLSLRTYMLGLKVLGALLALVRNGIKGLVAFLDIIRGNSAMTSQFIAFHHHDAAA